MFPVGTGMNRFLSNMQMTLKYVPRRHGDEPFVVKDKFIVRPCSP